MKIEYLLEKKEPTFSFEFFPPKTDEGEKKLFETIENLRELGPSFVSVTYGAGGGTRDKTIGWVSRIKNDLGIEAMAHLTCVGSTQSEIESILHKLQENGIENILALRGDPPKGEENFNLHPGGFSYANELAQFIRDRFDFCIGGAAFPEGHPESPSMEKDMDTLKTKVLSGMDFLITQLFFENRFYFDLIKRASDAGIKTPIIPGIMPITNVAQVERFTSLCGASIPHALRRKLHETESDPEGVLHLGIQYAIQQCRELLEKGAPGIHFYTLNRSPATRAIFENIKP